MTPHSLTPFKHLKFYNKGVRKRRLFMLGILSIGSVIYISFLVPRLLNHILDITHQKCMPRAYQLSPFLSYKYT